MPAPKILAAFTLVLSLAGPSLYSQEKVSEFKAPEDIDFRADNIVSEGTRMAAEVFAPKDPKSEKLPTIVMSHGWGGTAAISGPTPSRSPGPVTWSSRSIIAAGARATRGWSWPASKPEKKDGKLIAEVKEVREVVDPIDQTTDILNAIHWVAGEKQCDPERIGIWGSSFSGGHVVYVAARDPRVKAFVSQVGSMDSRWAIANPQMRHYTFSQGTAAPTGKIGYPKPGAKSSARSPAQPVIEKLAATRPSKTSAAARTARSCSSSPRTRSCSTTRTTRSWPTSGPRASRSS